MRNREQEEIEAAKAAYERYISNPNDKIIKRRRELQYVLGGSVPKPITDKTPPQREGIIDFKPAAANRLRRFIDNYFIDFQGMVTLTYGQIWPTDGREVKAHLKAFFERIRRSGWFENHSLVWWLEFQERGAPHIHMVVTGWLSKVWVSFAWHEVSGAPKETATRVEQLRSADAAGSYAAKYAAKSDQKEVPEGFTNVGRFWGCRGARPLGGGPRAPREVAAATPQTVRRLVAGVATPHTESKKKAREQGSRQRVIPVALPYCQLTGIRAYEHEGGWSFYGPEWEINALWLYLQANIAPTEQTGREQGDTRPKMSRGYTA